MDSISLLASYNLRRIANTRNPNEKLRIISKNKVNNVFRGHYWDSEMYNGWEKKIKEQKLFVFFENSMKNRKWLCLPGNLCRFLSKPIYWWIFATWNSKLKVSWDERQRPAGRKSGSGLLTYTRGNHTGHPDSLPPQADFLGTAIWKKNTLSRS